MKKLLVGLSLLALSATASADFFGSNNGEWKMGPYGPYWDESDWPEWTPMYWMEEFTDSWDNNNDNGGSYGMPFMGGGYPGMPSYGAPMGYGAPMMPPMGYGAPMMPAPQMGMPMMAPQPMPVPQMGAPMMAPLPVAPGATPGPSAAPAPTAAPVPPAN
ncbi:hypothetical protein VSS37_21755 [Candidatus Thiothrix sp. Deng01]|uniref:Sulfur globule protein CV1 n=1 Tax=Candidatus Thiothrix phosphatis TaxID=3112415 RepID=A0ABU6D3D9_9GAMM|nr:hypothetical protein [Candidatus Thiothrix sp. Deng01]MEB4593610.1 hypothetical protein [Candidatus Thiothrix sp. Deng01]